MGINLKKGGSGSFERPEDGAYFVRLIGIADLGMQPDFAYGEGATAGVIDGGYKISLSYELVTKQNSEGKNFVQTEELNVKLGDRANLSKRLKAFDPTGALTNNWTGGIENLIGLAGYMTIGSTASGRSKVAGMTSAPEGIPISEATIDTYVLDFDAPIMDEYLKIPKFIQEKLHKAEGFPDSPLHLGMLKMGIEDPIAANGQY